MGYLVISRRVSERIQIGNDIIILISDITLDDEGRSKVNVAIDAPRELAIKRCSTHLEEQSQCGPKHRNKS